MKETWIKVLVGIGICLIVGQLVMTWGFMVWTWGKQQRHEQVLISHQQALISHTQALQQLMKNGSSDNKK